MTEHQQEQARRIAELYRLYNDKQSSEFTKAIVVALGNMLTRGEARRIVRAAKSPDEFMKIYLTKKFWYDSMNGK